MTLKYAVISPCGLYRYWLERRWGPGKPLVFVMVNPSKADGSIDDHTITKCTEFTKLLGFNAFIVVNLHALRATDPAALRLAADPVGPDNAWYVGLALKWAGTVIVAWGKHGTYRDADIAFLRSPGASATPLHALRINGDGTPAHPLMLPYSCKLIPYTAEVRNAA